MAESHTIHYEPGAAVEPEGAIESGVIKATEAECPEAAFQRQEDQVLGDVSGFEEHVSIATWPVLLAGVVEDSAQADNDVGVLDERLSQDVFANFIEDGP